MDMVPLRSLFRWLAIHFPFGLTLFAPAYLLLVGDSVSQTVDWAMVGLASIAVLWGLFLVFAAPPRWPVAGHTVFCVYLSVIIGFASVYHLALTTRLTQFRIDQELDLEELRLTRQVKDLDLRLRYLANIYTANEHAARAFGTKQMLEDVEQAYKTGGDRTLLALFGGSDESAKDLPLAIIEQDYSGLSGSFRENLAAIDLNTFRSTINRAREHNYSDMASVVDTYWKARGYEQVRIPFATVLNDLEDLFTALDSAKQALTDRAYSKSSYLNMLHFSFVVGSTLGFGDIVPNSPAVRSLVITELALTMFVVVIAVNRWARRRSPATDQHAE